MVEFHVCVAGRAKHDILMIDENASKLAWLEGKGFKVLKVDELSSKNIEGVVERWGKVFILGDDNDTNVKLVKITRKLIPNATIIANAPDKESEVKMGEIENIITIHASEIATNALKSALETSETERTASLLRKILQRTMPQPSE